MFLEIGGIIGNWGQPQPILFLGVCLTGKWRIFVTRTGKTWPLWQLVCAILGVDALVTLFCVFGWLSGGSLEQSSPPDPVHFSNGPTSIVTVSFTIWRSKKSWVIYLGQLDLCSLLVPRTSKQTSSKLIP